MPVMAAATSMCTNTGGNEEDDGDDDEDDEDRLLPVTAPEPLPAPVDAIVEGICVWIKLCRA